MTENIFIPVTPANDYANNRRSRSFLYSSVGDKSRGNTDGKGIEMAGHVIWYGHSCKYRERETHTPPNLTETKIHTVQSSKPITVAFGASAKRLTTEQISFPGMHWMWLLNIVWPQCNLSRRTEVLEGISRWASLSLYRPYSWHPRQIS